MNFYQESNSEEGTASSARHSREISKADADAEINKRLALGKNLADNIDTLTQIVGEPRAEVESFYANKGNGFLFTKQSVLRHFFKNPEDLDQRLFNENTDLLAVLAAHNTQEATESSKFGIGDPTIIIAGVKENLNRSQEEKSQGIHKFLFQTEGNPGDEYPPIFTIPEIGIDKTDRTITIQFLQK